MKWIDCHTPSIQADIEANKLREPEGERIRAELIDWMTRNKIVSVLLNTEKHNVDIQIAKLPPEIKPVLTLWGSIFVENPGGGHTPPKEWKYLVGDSAAPSQPLEFVESPITPKEAEKEVASWFEHDEEAAPSQPQPPMRWTDFKKTLDLCESAEKLLEWMPIYSTGSSGHIRQTNLRTAIEQFREAAPSVQPGQAKGKYPIDRPCSACSAGDYDMEHHDHHPPFRAGCGPEATVQPEPRK